MYENISHKIWILVEPLFSEQASYPEKQHYIWTYSIIIKNLRSHSIQLLYRYWRIIDAVGKVQEVYGEGVVGQQPILESNTSFEYESHASISTSSGIMVGYYLVKTDEGEYLKIIIPPFSLDSPYEIRKMHS